MPELKPKLLFISHAWIHDDHYLKLVEWLNNEPGFCWKNCSVPGQDSLTDTTEAGLKAEMSRQIALSEGVIIFAGMYAAHSDWIIYEINEAKRMGKVIIGIDPWGQQRVPEILQDAADAMVAWDSYQIIATIQLWLPG